MSARIGYVDPRGCASQGQARWPWTGRDLSLQTCRVLCGLFRHLCAGVVTPNPLVGVVEKPCNNGNGIPTCRRECRGRIHAALAVGEKSRVACMRPLHTNKFSLVGGLFQRPLVGRAFLFLPPVKGVRGVVFKSRERRSGPAPAFPRSWRYRACARVGQNRAREREEFRWARAGWTFTGQSRRTRRPGFGRRTDPALRARAELLKNAINSRGFSINS